MLKPFREMSLAIIRCCRQGLVYLSNPPLLAAIFVSGKVEMQVKQALVT